MRTCYERLYFLGFVFPFIVNGLLGRVGLPWTLRIWALIEIVVGGIALLGIKSRLPTPKFRKGQPRPRFIPPQVRFLKQPVFWTYVSLIVTVRNVP